MSTRKLSISSTLDAMKPEQNTGKAENDSLDSLIQRAIGKEQGSSEIQNSSLADDAVDEKGHALGYYDRVRSLTSDVNGVKEPFLSTKAKGIPLKGSKSSSEQMQSLKIPEAVVAFAQAAAKANDDPEKYLSSWSLFSSPKVQMQKCEKCSQEFCSPINYRRHIRIHRRSPQINKDFPKNRELLASFWDKLSFEATREILSMKDVKLEDIAGSSIIRALVSFMRTAAFSSLPHVYLKAGTGLLDVIQSRDPGSSVSSWELFSILDDASEKTFLCVGAATSLTKFLFDGESGKMALETKNLVACTSFLVEQNLVEAWLADKDAEALRCHKLLLEEEEAAQKRQAVLLERRRLKKLKRKGRRNKENIDLDKEDSKEGLPDTVEGGSCSAGTSSPRSMAEPGTNTWEAGSDPVEELQPIQYFHDGINTDVAGDVLHSQNMDFGMQQGNIQWQQTGAWQPTSKSVGNLPNGSHPPYISATKSAAGKKHGSHKDQKPALLANGHKVWTRKAKPQGVADTSDVRPEREINEHSDQHGNHELMIGCMSPTLDPLGMTHTEPDSNMNGSHRSMVKIWRPVSRHGNGGCATAQNDKKETGACRAPNGGTEDDMSSKDSMLEDTHLADRKPFSSNLAEAFLAQRWKEAMAYDHVKLVISPDGETMEYLDVHERSCTDKSQQLDCYGRTVLGNAENRMTGPGSLDQSAIGVTKPKFRMKTEKGGALKYVPKQRNNS